MICFEGIDGSGKSTLGALLAQAIASRGQDCSFVERKSPEFPKAYQTQRMTLFREVIWEYGDDPIQELGDLHSLYIMAGWFAALDVAKIQPLLKQGSFVVLDNWYYKFAARYALKSTVSFQHVEDCFAHLHTPDHVVLLDVDPELALRRKDQFNLAEIGALDGLSSSPAQDFVRYQQRVRDVLLGFAKQHGWVVVTVGRRTPSDVLEEVLERLRLHGHSKGALLHGSPACDV